MNDTNNQNLGGSIPPTNVASGGQTPPPPPNTNVSVPEVGQPSPFSDDGVPPSMSPLADVQNIGGSAMPTVSSTPFQGPNMNNSEDPSTSFATEPQPQAPQPIQQPAQPIQPPQPNSEQPPITAVPPAKKGSKFRTFIIVAIIAIVAIYSVVAFLYMQNQKLKEGSEAPVGTSTEVTDEDAGTLPTPTTAQPQVSSENVKIVNGNVVLQGTGGDSTILIDKKDFSGTGITGFARVAVSNDSKMLCFESWPPSPEPALYVAKSDGTDVKEVSPNRQNCLWSKDSTAIYYTDYLSKTSSKNILMYDVEAAQEKNMTLSSQTTAANRQFDIVGLSADGGKLVCKYTDPQNVTGNCEVNLSTLEVTTSE